MWFCLIFSKSEQNACYQTSDFIIHKRGYSIAGLSSLVKISKVLISISEISP